MTLGFKGKNVVVYGLGKSGLASAMALAEDGAHIFLMEDGDLAPISENPAFKRLTQDYGAQVSSANDVPWSKVVSLFKSPGVPWDAKGVKKAQENTVPVMGSIDLLYRANPDAMFIGITGTNGKSTTTSLVGHVLKHAGLDAAVGGNIGEAVMTLPQGKPIYVLELSSYMLEMTQEIIFDRAVLLNLTPDHLDRHGSMEEYLKIKKRIFNHQAKGHTAVVSLDDDILQDLPAELTAEKVRTISAWRLGGEVHIDHENTLCVLDYKMLPMKEYPNLPGRHNGQNVAAVYALLSDLVDEDTFIDALHTFRALPHRMEQASVCTGVICVNDSKATNAEATIHALESFENIYWIAGGVAKENGIKPCLDHLQNVRAAFTIGEAGEDFLDVLSGHVETYQCHELEEAVRQAWQTIRREGLKDSCLLLSPACASWDQFRSFEHRGDAFCNYCRQLCTEESCKA